MTCHFEPSSLVTKPGFYRYCCAICRRAIFSKQADPARCHRMCPGVPVSDCLQPQSTQIKVGVAAQVSRATCTHLGDGVRLQECDTCQGKTRIKVFACAVHGECAISKLLDGVKCCAACGDYEAA